MIEDANLVPRGTRLEVDVCVVGAGTAGIPLALSLTGKGLTVLMLEAEHVPGGATRHWNGRCVPLDPLDFEARPHVPHSGWPISYEGLLPYYARANAWLEAGAFAYDARQVLPAGPMIASVDGEALRLHGLERYSCPTDFGRRYRKRMQVATDLRVLTGARCTALRMDAAGATVRTLDVATGGGNRFAVRASVVVLAAGALQTPRLLLCSAEVAHPSAARALDAVGRYAHAPLAGTVGSLTVKGDPARVRHGFEQAADGAYCRRRIAIDPARQEALGLMNAVARLVPADDSGDPAPTSALAWWQAVGRHAHGLARAPWHAPSLLADGWRHTLSPRRLPAVAPRRPSQRFAVELQVEQQPLPSSRITLAEGSDGLGMRRLRVDWRQCLADFESARRSLREMGDELARCRIGRLEFDPATLREDLLRRPPARLVGTTRMGRDLRTSVVDPDGKLHTVTNLYVAGAAVFPTCGQADPALTEVALAVRLADRLVQRLQPRRAPTEEIYA